MVAKRFVVCPDCKREFSKSADACPRCGWKPKKSRKSFSCCGVIAALLVVGFAGVVVIAIVSPGHPRDSMPSPPPVASTPAKDTAILAGGRVVIQSPGGIAFGAIDDRTWTELQDAIAIKDAKGIELLMEQGRVMGPESGTRGFVVDTAIGSIKVRIEGGEMDGQTGWFRRSDLRKVD